MSNPFKAGDTVIISKGYVDVTVGKRYNVDGINGDDYISITDDVQDEHDIQVVHCQLVSLLTTGLRANPHGQQAFKAQYQHDPYELQAVNEEDYDTCKASARVTSAGSFEKGDKVVYKDGTPIPTEYGYFKVTRCTATAVWFEHCYSMPFNPTEFKRA